MVISLKWRSFSADNLLCHRNGRLEVRTRGLNHGPFETDRHLASHVGFRAVLLFHMDFVLDSYQQLALRPQKVI